VVIQLKMVEVFEALDRLESNSELVSSKTLLRILRYIIEEELNGRGDRIKALSIAWDVLDKPKDFNPQQDPVVRVNFNRLRRSLNDYYENSGRNDPIMISVPIGAYRPVFLHRNIPKQVGVSHELDVVVPDVGVEVDIAAITTSTKTKSSRVNRPYSQKLLSTIFSFLVFGAVICTGYLSIIGSYSLFNQNTPVAEEVLNTRAVLHVLPFKSYSKSIDPILIETLRRKIIICLSGYPDLSVRLHSLESAAQQEMGAINNVAYNKAKARGITSLDAVLNAGKLPQNVDQSFSGYQLTASAHEDRGKIHVLLVLSMAIDREVVWSHDFSFHSDQTPSEPSIHAEVELIALNIAGERGGVLQKIGTLT
jgi:hypothetical protein